MPQGARVKPGPLFSFFSGLTQTPAYQSVSQSVSQHLSRKMLDSKQALLFLWVLSVEQNAQFLSQFGFDLAGGAVLDHYGLGRVEEPGSFPKQF